jgi:hypothetical protein
MSRNRESQNDALARAILTAGLHDRARLLDHAHALRHLHATRLLKTVIEDDLGGPTREGGST